MAGISLHELDEKVIGNTYHRFPLTVAKAKGAWVFDAKGKRYLDYLSGVAVLPLGHCHPEIVKAITSQVSRYIHLSNYFAEKGQVELAALLIENTYADKVFFVNTGTEATELAIKMARKWALRNRGRRAKEIISLENSFHGRTMGAITLTAQERFHAGIGPLMGGVKSVPYNNIAAVKAAFSNKTAAVIAEPVQCEGGINIPQIDYMTQLKNLCKKYNVLLIADEVQTGIGRTGRFLACEHSLLTPDITLLGKSLGGGLPLGAVLATDAVANALSYGDHGTTMGGNPVACAAGTAMLRFITEKKLIQQAEDMGNYIKNALFDLRKKHPEISGIRNLGLIIGFEYDHAEDLVAESLAQGLIINHVQKNTVRMLPPFITTPAEVKQAMTILSQAIKKVGARAAQEG
ncbi:MAG: acetylornithine/succinylornithine family transaminase [Spirochaetota bacterium]|jgi:predicted acetylornithine/succinylornithine family transaminase|nr:acetylornithine/succinylornithine family transaminase [Spirochaetota bacterium]